MNQKKHNDKLNRSIQALLFQVVAEDGGVTARRTVALLSELYRRRIWTDARTVNVLGQACISPSVRVSVAAVSFFLGIQAKMDEDDEEEREKLLGSSEVDYHQHSKKTRKRQRDVEKQEKKNSKLREKKDKSDSSASAVPLFPAIQLLRDPQQLAEQLVSKL